LEPELAELAERTPGLAVVELGRRIERALKRIAATGGVLPEVRISSLANLTLALARLGANDSLVEAINRFRRVRNAAAHDEELSPGAVNSAIESGLRILDALHMFPIAEHIVKHANVPIYADEKRTKRVEGASAVVLRDSLAGDLHAYPTAQSYFQSGMSVSWEWNIRRTFRESWYRDPDTDEVRYGWTSAAEFIGRRLDKI
jgi:hypothetical protein